MSRKISSEPADTLGRDERLDALMAEYVEVCETGAGMDREALLRQHPDLADDLRSFFANRDRMEALAAPVREGNGRRREVLDNIRYFGDYELLEEIARGGMGVVYRARQISLGRIVAVKMILAGRLATADDVERFREEAQAAAGLKDSGIVAIHEVGEHEGQHYFSMDYIEGPSLADLAKEAPLPGRMCAELLRDIARAVHAAHQQGVLHRDLKPSNVLLERDEGSGQRDERSKSSSAPVRSAARFPHPSSFIPKITDFGLAKRVESDSDLTATGQILGTPAYMAPEQAAGVKELIGRASDVYSLGVILYELLTGRPPIRGETPVETLMQVQTVEPVSPRLLNPKVPRDLETVSLKCLQKEPARRYASALDLAHDLERFLSGEPILARPVGRIERAWRWCRRHPLPTGLLALILILLGLVAGVASAAWFREAGLRKVAQREEKSASREKGRAERALADLRAEQERASGLVGDVATLESERDQLTDRNQQVRRTYYQDLLDLARTQWQAGNAMQAAEYLDQCPEELRDEEWQALKAQWSHEFLRLPGRRQMAISHDGNWLAAIGEDEASVCVWRLPSGELAHAFRVPEGEIAALAFHPGGGLVAAGGDAGWIRLWRMDDGETAGTTAVSGQIGMLTFSPDGERLLAATRCPPRSDTGNAGTIFAWNVATLQPEESRRGWEIALCDRSGRYFATGVFGDVERYGRVTRKSRVQVWDTSHPRSDAEATLVAGDSWRCPPSFAAGRIAVLNYLEGVASEGISIFDVDAGRLLRFIAPGFKITSFCLSPDGSRIAYGIGGEFLYSHAARGARQDYRIVIWNLEKNEEELVVPWQDHPPSSIAFTPDGTRLATADEESVKLWNVSLPRDPVEVILADIRELNVRPGDSPQWGGSRARVNTRDGKNIPAFWNIGRFDRGTGEWKSAEAVNVKWVAQLGSQTYGNPVVANGRVFLGTNNGAGYLKRYPQEVDLGVLLCLHEQTGGFLWQHSNEKLPTGRVHDWPLQGVCSTPTVDGDRLWYVSNRGEVVCLDTEGFYDGEDDGPVTGERIKMLEVDIRDKTSAAIREQLTARGVRSSQHIRWIEADHAQVQVGNSYGRFVPHFDVREVDGVLTVSGTPDTPADTMMDAFTFSGPFQFLKDEQQVRAYLIDKLRALDVEIAAATALRTIEDGQKWAITGSLQGAAREFEMELSAGMRIQIHTTMTTADIHEADVVWRFNMMTELGVSQHNMANCSVLTLGDKLFVCTSNGIDETHINLPAPDAPSFMAMDRNTGRVLWTDKSPGKNILHAQWASPSYGVFDGKPQVIFPGGDGWLYSFDPEGDGKGGAKLLWKFDCNPKESEWILNGRGTRNNIIAFPAIYDGLVYIAVGQDPEHGEGPGRLWCIDPTKRTDGADVSAELAVNLDGKIIPHRRIQAVDVSQGERAIPNPDSAVVWHYAEQDLDGDGKIGFEETFHRSLCIPAIKDDILYIADFSGLFHCLHAKTGEVFWTYDMLAACWGSPLLVDGKVYIGDEDGDITIFSHSPDPHLAKRRPRGVGDAAGWRLIQEINMGNAVYMTPIVAGDVLYIANKTHLFAIAADKEK